MKENTAKNHLRMLVGLDILLHGLRVIRLEFAAGAVIALGLGALSIMRSRGPWTTGFGVYLVALSVNYIHLLLLACGRSAEVGYLSDLQQRLAAEPELAARYTVRSLMLLVPLSTLGALF